MPDVVVPVRRRPPVPIPGPLGILLTILGLTVLAAAVLLSGATPLVARQPPTPMVYVALSAILFTTGAFGVLIRRNALMLFMCVELMLNASNLAFVAFSRMHGTMDGQAIVLFVMIVAAAEVAVGLAIIVSIYRRRLSTNVDDVSLLKW